MLRDINDLGGYAVLATDGEVGYVTEFYFDDEKWVIRYLVVECGSWLSRRKVLITPISIGKPDWGGRILPVSITRAQVRDSPDIDTDKPVSRQHEMDYLGHYGYPAYWGGAGLWGINAYPGMISGSVISETPGAVAAGYGLACSGPRQARPDHAVSQAEVDRRERGDPHLRSCEAVRKYRIEATDGGVGHVLGMLFDDETWAIRYFIVNTSNWWLGHEMLIAARLIRSVSWAEQSVSVNLTRKEVKEAPAYDATETGREQDPVLHRYPGMAESLGGRPDRGIPSAAAPAAGDRSDASGSIH
jgi:hypothetical protein